MRLPTTARRAAFPIAAVLLLLASACSDAPAPGEQLEVDGESPVITDPGGVANQLSNDEITGDDVPFEEIQDD